MLPARRTTGEGHLASKEASTREAKALSSRESTSCPSRYGTAIVLSARPSEEGAVQARDPKAAEDGGC